jgi:hypothetical protein
MTVARHVGTGLEDFDGVARLGELVGDHGSRESRADDGDILFHLFYPKVELNLYACGGPQDLKLG